MNKASKASRYAIKRRQSAGKQRPKTRVLEAHDSSPDILKSHPKKSTVSNHLYNEFIKKSRDRAYHDLVNGYLEQNIYDQFIIDLKQNRIATASSARSINQQSKYQDELLFEVNE